VVAVSSDEIGTPFAVTVDFETLDDKSVTIRDRDSMEQVRVPIAELPNWLGSRLPA
jgi:glycyl-tRNA synthetase